ncbi:MAG: cohesin domain-containing protein, partial [Candidatus Latescibacteria bacterium]|nr:cohesin domain-containing protein [Candidatus Latescibacterota bacterium]
MTHIAPRQIPSSLRRLLPTAFIAALWAGSALAAVNVDVGNVTTPRSSTVTVPVSVANVAAEEIVAVEVFLSFDPSKVSYSDLDTTG